MASAPQAIMYSPAKLPQGEYEKYTKTGRVVTKEGTVRSGVGTGEEHGTPAGLGEEAVQFAAGEVAKLQDGLAELRRPSYIAAMAEAAAAVVACIRGGSKVMFCGNGGSAADAQHLAAELVGRQNYDRAPAAGISLTVDTSVLTALGNDYGYDEVFSRQVQALGRPGDMLVGISTSGRSRNVVKALLAARAAGITSIGFTGRDPADMEVADFVLAMPADETAKIQELQLVAGHIVFALVERALFPPGR